MGLDMYLYGVKSSYKMHDYNLGQVETRIEIGYWRKANAIHAWFVNNCQDGIDNCATYFVSRKDLENLKRACEGVLANPNQAEDLLPTQSGFFFGPTEYDEYYFNDMQETIEICKYALSKDFDYFEYQSSW